MENSFSHCKRVDVDVSQGPPKKRKGDVMQIHGVINTPPVSGENAPSSSRHYNKRGVYCNPNIIANNKEKSF
jgi:hypothetical protein